MPAICISSKFTKNTHLTLQKIENLEDIALISNRLTAVPTWQGSWRRLTRGPEAPRVAGGRYSACWRFEGPRCPTPHGHGRA